VLLAGCGQSFYINDTAKYSFNVDPPQKPDLKPFDADERRYEIVDTLGNWGA
jgi:hypothetical protein